MAEKGKGFLRAASSLLGGRVQSLNDLSNAANSLDRGTNSTQKDHALQKAGEHVRDNFSQCRHCGKWVCLPVCWNTEIGQCLTCSPNVQDTLAAEQSQAQVAQIQEKVKAVDWTADVDVKQRAIVECPHCHAHVGGGKFCPECGQTLSTKHVCGSCGAESDAGVKFCPECGSKF